MAHNVPRRSPKEIIEELTRLQETSSEARDRLSMLHEISVYQEELIVQNEELTLTQTALEETRDRFIELYDFAPSGYLTLDEHGVIRQCNLTAAALIGKSKQALEGIPLLAFVAPHDRNTYLAFLRRSRTTSKTGIETELTLQSGNGPRHIQLICRRHGGRDGSGELFTALVDVTDRRRLEHDRDQIARERAALAGRLIAIQDDERLRIARNLHDDLGQQVTALRLKLEELSSAIPEGTAGTAVARVQEILEQLDRRLHFVASELRPAALDLGIVAAMEQFVREWSATFGVPAVFHSGGVAHGALSPHIETHLYRIAQEALNNAAKYAVATQVTVLLEHRDDGVALMIEDDGRGFDLDAARRRGEGLGLVGMRERAQIVGGRLEVETRPGHGTTVFVYVPRDSVDNPA
jgi:PAS domain S-box-containing protein